MKYKIVGHNSIEHLEEEVNKHLEQGYKCQGGLVIDDKGYFKFKQAMIKE